MKPILVDGGWSDYSSTSSSCSTTCERGVTRECNNPSPCGGGNDCNGPSANYECCDNCTGMSLLKKDYKLSVRQKLISIKIRNFFQFPVFKLKVGMDIFPKH